MRYQILEAFALGRAVVSTSLGAEGIEITEGENIVIRDDPGQFGDSVARCLTDAVFRDGLGRSTRIPAEEKYSWPAIASRFASVIQTIGDNDALRNPA